MASVNDCLVQLQKLTQQNLEILQAINDAFLSNQNHLSVKVGDTSYAIPSFISLENKINNLQDNFENLINAPKTGEAYFNLDGNSRAIEVRSYTHTPNSLKLKTPESFGIQDNDIFKDFLTPIPYVNFDLKSLPNDITSVNIKKVIPKSSALLSEFVSKLENKSASEQSWADLYKILSLYKENTDYIEYDVVKKLPIRKNIGSGTYVIEKIISDVIDENLDEYITLKLRSDVSNTYSNKLSYKLFDETIEKLLQVGDQLVTFDDSAKMEITEISHNTNTIQVKVLNGEYLNLISDTESEEEHINDLAKIKFYSPVDFDNDKYINIPLEEDQYVFIAIAPLNDRMNIQAPWGSGVIIDTYKLTNGDISFKEYYQENVRNIGDALYELTAMSSGSLSKLSREDFGTLINTQAELDIDNMKVVQINTHLNDSVTVKNIRALYSQKKRYNTELSEIQTKIDDINSKLASVSFDDTSNLRTVYTAQLTEYNKTKNELVTSLTKIIDEISISANNSDIPIENAKYHIRGFYKLSDEDNLNVRGIKVQYRYKNLDNTYGKATTIKDDFLFSDWNEVNNYRPKVATYGNIGYEFSLQENTDKQNTPSFNQIDIPISQGETVDIRVKKIYDYGYPYVEITSGWSEVINIEFPKEYLKDVQILDIITENNSDIETNRFENILREAGIPDHIGDKIQDQDITYFHKPENISSGFYTPERRIVPLKDKLAELSNLVTLLQDEVLGTSADSLDVSVNIGDISNKLNSFQDNLIYVESYDEFLSTFPKPKNQSHDPNNINASMYYDESLTINDGIYYKDGDTYYTYDNGSRIDGEKNGDNIKFSKDNTEYKIAISEDNVVYDIETITSGVYSLDSTGVVYAPLNITLTNPTSHSVKLYSLFPGSRDTILNNIINYKFDVGDYLVGYSSASQIEKLSKDLKDFQATLNDYKNHYDTEIDVIKDKIFNIERDIIELKDENAQIKTFNYLIKEASADVPTNVPINNPIDITFKATITDNKGDKKLNIKLSNINFPVDGHGQAGDQKTLTIKEVNGANEPKLSFEISDYNIKNINLKECEFVIKYYLDKNAALIREGKDVSLNKLDVELAVTNTSNQIEYWTITKQTPEPASLSLIQSKSLIINEESIHNYQDSDIEKYGDQNSNNKGVWLKYLLPNQSNGVFYKLALQTANQFIMFRTYATYTGLAFYEEGDKYKDSNKLSADSNFIELKGNEGATIYPIISKKYGLCMDTDNTNNYLLVNPGETVIVPTVFEYKLNKIDSIQKTMSFDLRTSLYKDPINYTFTVIAKKDATIQDTVLNTNRKYINDIKYSTTVVK